VSRFADGSLRCALRRPVSCGLQMKEPADKKEVPPLDAFSGTGTAASMAYMACGAEVAAEVDT
jgi:hypothetical protein